ncbi:DUF2249 domain-containing protein [Mesorhizobium sp. M1E.F.Ca.ET.045.02.1.1]|uniref:DUF2249 domain-containing protein n=1 Tax=Mesorhizobium sp. M1E.F.Ca.ET.045.02.1.1 TaxID=2493672 RepID=UPI000F762CC9|nr:DUF2249 domain-containing protein [Mesorhizobium sp. M1E.F.Ca.ET.045.02.1.1]AZO23585.1 DUF2249 domain-containing protein [Mesorhizobium sp. M1E.F.Ca.ET.045.02.1.1]
MTQSDYELDVRPILAQGGEPFGAVMEAVATLAPGQNLCLLAPFKPVPLFHVLGQRGFEPTAREIGNGDWEVIFRPIAGRQDSAVAERDSATDRTSDIETWPESVVELDNRGLEPPEPMVRTLEGVEALSPGETLAALLPREPVFLFEELERRGHLWRGAFEPEGHYRVVIRRG